MFGNYCAGCHGFSAISGFVTPDLRRSAAIQDAATFRSIVRDGALLGNGMPGFGKRLSVENVENIRAFVASEARYIYGLEHGRLPPPSASRGHETEAGVTGGPQ
jgi:alcohol dehydrogenase (cytochrome c)/quinohemoprotein ethanol dehydrogenase